MGSRTAVSAFVLTAALLASAQDARDDLIPANSSLREKVLAKRHGFSLAISFLGVLPLGSISARYLRAFWPFNRWLSVHAGLQLIVLPLICFGFGTGVHLAKIRGQWLVPHTKIGLTLFIMYWIQLTLGVLTAGTPSVALGNAQAKPGQPDMRHPIKARPWYALLHAFWGVSMCIIASVQVRRGYTIEWPAKSGKPADVGIDRLWKAWVVIIPVLYLGGLFLLKRQWAQERARMQNANEVPPQSQKYESVDVTDPTSPHAGTKSV